MMSIRRFRNISGLLGTILKWFSLVFLVPLAFAIFKSTPLLPFVIPMVVGSLMGWALERTDPEPELEMADGFLLVVVSWLAVSLLGAFPYVLSGNGALANPINALFESASGFTCTGSTIMSSISLEDHPHSVMIWRQLTQWLGGMGILVLAVAVLPRLSVGGAQFLDNEVPGPKMDRLTPHMAETARRLWIIYIAASALLFVILLAYYLLGIDERMDPFQAFAHTLTTLPSGGFSPQGRSVEAFSPAVQWTLIPFMFIAGMNFTLLWRALFSGPRALNDNSEFKVYVGLFVAVGLLLGGILALDGQYVTLEANMRHGFFQMATFLTTTGFASTDFAQWSGHAMAILVILMFIAGCVGSTSGGLKIMRWIVAIKVVLRDITRQIHPSVVRPLKLGRRALSENVVRGAMTLIVVYFILFALSLLVVAVDVRLAGIEVPIADLASSIAATLGNIGPGFGKVGPMESFGFLPDFTKCWMSFLMIAGRLEIMTFLVVLSPDYWRD